MGENQVTLPPQPQSDENLVISSATLAVSYGCAIIMQLLMLYLKLNYQSLHSKVQLFLSCFIPFAFCVEFHLYLGLVLFGLFFFNCAHIFYCLAIKKEDDSSEFAPSSSSPRSIYRQLVRIHKTAQALTLLGCAYFLFAILLVLYTTPNEDRFQQRAYYALSPEQQQARADNALRCTFHLLQSVFLVFVAGYIGCLQKDLARMIHFFIHKRYYRSSRNSSNSNYANTCVLCRMEIKTLLFFFEDEARKKNKHYYYDDDEENILTLQCNHRYHESCLIGFSIIGKKQTSPCCGEKLDTSTIYRQSPWENATSVWMETTEVIRLFLAFFFPMGMIVFIHHFRREHHFALGELS